MLRATDLYLLCKVASVLHSWPQNCIQSSSQWSTNGPIIDFKNASILICSLETWRTSEISKFFKWGRFLWQWVDYSKQNKLLRYHMSCCIIDTFSLPHNGPSGNCAYIHTYSTTMFHTSISKVRIVAFLFLLIFAIKLIIKIVTWNVLLDIMIINTGTSVLFQTSKVIHGTILTVLDYFSWNIDCPWKLVF